MVGAVTIATHDKSFAVTPDYYQRAVHWDEEQAARRASEKLGWRVSIETAPQADPLGRRVVSVVLTDAQGQALPAAQLDVTYFHDAHANEPQTLKLTPDPDDARRFTQKVS